MMKYFKLQILLVVLMIMGSIPGIYAINMVQHDSGMNIVEMNTVTQGSKIIYVANNGTDRNDGLTPAKPKRNIENAINAANQGDTIKLAPGTYHKNVVINKSITLTGDNQKNTIIDGQHISNCIKIHNGTTVTIINLTLKNGHDGKGYLMGSRTYGGGISNSGTLHLENSTITDNYSKYAAGIDNKGTMTMKNVIIKNNTADYQSGGIENSGTLNLENSTITNNTASDGGGIENIGKMTIKGVLITNNKVKDYGGGIANYGELTIEDSTIKENNAKTAGGIGNNYLIYIYGSTITHNTANEFGGFYNSEISESIAYMDDITLITGNTPNNFKGKPFIPA